MTSRHQVLDEVARKNRESRQLKYVPSPDDIAIGWQHDHETILAGPYSDKMIELIDRYRRAA